MIKAKVHSEGSRRAVARLQRSQRNGYAREQSGCFGEVTGLAGFDLGERRAGYTIFSEEQCVAAERPHLSWFKQPNHTQH